MAEPAKESDQSMEDILQSIKRIIADEGDAAPTASGSDVLELTELLAEDAAPPMVAPTPAPMPEPAPIAEPVRAMEPTPAPVVTPAAIQMPTPASAPTSAPATFPTGLMSDAALAASAAALNALAHKPDYVAANYTSPQLRSGVTVEDLVVEALKPMLKEWLDGNLPELVRMLVEREIRRVSGH